MLYIVSDHTAVTLTITLSGTALLSIHVGMNYYWFCSSCFPFLLSQLYYRESMYSQFSLQVVLVMICEWFGCGSPISKSGFEVQRTLWHNSYGNQLRGEIVVGVREGSVRKELDVSKSISSERSSTSTPWTDSNKMCTEIASKRLVHLKIRTFIWKLCPKEDLQPNHYLLRKLFIVNLKKSGLRVNCRGLISELRYRSKLPHWN